MFKVPEGYILIKKEDYAMLIHTVQDLTNKIKILTARVEELESQLHTNSQNSNKPPSSDGYRKVIKNNREKGQNKQGAQPGHKGSTLQMTDCPDKIILHSVSGVCSCGEDLKNAEVVKTVRQQVIDFPVKLIEITEHQVEVRKCKCGQEHQAIKPYSANVQYGERIKGFLTYANQYQYIPFERLQEFAEDCLGINISDGLIEQANELCYQNLSETEEQIKLSLIESAVIHNDETGIRCENKLQWIHNCSNTTYTHYSIQPKRGKEGMDKIGILPNYIGNSIHDRLSSYDNYINCKHSFCNSHHLRELTYINEEIGRDWAKEMKELLIRANQAKNERVADRYYQQAIESWYKQILIRGYAEEPPAKINSESRRGRKARSRSRRLLDVFRDKQEQVMGFLYDEKIPFDNNLAERDIRMVKLKQKISGCFRTYHGAEVFCRIRSYISTIRKQGHPVLEGICMAITGQPIPVFISSG
jgi:transposase